MAGELVLGIVLALGGGALLALAMVTQRYALAFPPGKVQFLGCALPRNIVWFIGLVIYGAANGLYAVAQLFGPLSLLAGVFTTLLIWNMLFAKILLREQLTAPRIYGATVILVGVILCIVATPADVETEFTPKDIEDLSSRWVGATYIAILLFLVLGSVAAIVWYESKYPRDAKAEGHGKDSFRSIETETSSSLTDRGEGDREPGKAGQEVKAKLSTPQAPPAEESALPAEPEQGGEPRMDAATAGTAAALTATATATPPAWLDRVMGLVYPGSLGVDEGIAHLTLKASVSMLDTCSGAGECGSGTLYGFAGVWVMASLATLWWLRRVFSRYETTLALPVEYGTVNAVSACSGLLFYREAALMAPWQLAVMLVGIALILLGIALGRTSSPSPAQPHTSAGAGDGGRLREEAHGAATLAFQV